MKNMLQRENVQIVESVKDWIDAIHVGVQPLIDGGYVEARYIDAIIENTEKFGPYYVLCKDLALLHASSEQGVLKKQLAITILRQPVRFKPDGFDVRLLVTLAASDSESHMQAMQAVSNIFTDEKRIEQLATAKTADDAYTQFIAAANE
ncbi:MULTISPECIES: PTS sugar transporter subunit IIA [Breznakia]|uniref:PTS system ascorbate-specific IIA component n=1 Tax=Breznakia blatticola TaxID=1754012 RepID=A0A4R7ZFJ8_9FIRM|nr:MULTISPECIES: PTS sugar transporter subunit IIA [Breznakia]MDH6366227.1 PTS system ascorbate-specific IIA component [Breznakia sp. PH1-1]MDH6403320.1 PTS system ascorbate-specific IIA component [Breznakia sp. PF1-11]MDH6411029.1 PTS system ascorbate-specific IIA component [Breznakia sp. PFB1-11]MDH6413393.1 PTS system ascorbate-specific IIA component [Breznakia sp. PFB1-14]MDH6416158.1 PTS system ascorbate-specific IIA component [Breznakia sp. PFB1-4]